MGWKIPLYSIYNLLKFYGFSNKKLSEKLLFIIFILHFTNWCIPLFFHSHIVTLLYEIWIHKVSFLSIVQAHKKIFIFNLDILKTLILDKDMLMQSCSKNVFPFYFCNLMNAFHCFYYLIWWTNKSGNENFLGCNDFPNWYDKFNY